jgi:hypothetical protein
MPNDACAFEAAVHAARRSGRWEPELLEHLRECPVCTEVSEVSGWIQGLGPQPNAPALPDPDVIWVRARISASADAAARALRVATLRKTLRYGVPCAAAAWLLLDWMQTEGVGLRSWAQAIAYLSANPVTTVAISALAALAAALVSAGLTVGRPMVARQLRDLGLL